MLQGPNYWSGSGPSKDHTTGRGSYLLLDTGDDTKKVGDTAIVHSTWLTKGSSREKRSAAGSKFLVNTESA